MTNTAPTYCGLTAYLKPSFLFYEKLNVLAFVAPVFFDTLLDNNVRLNRFAERHEIPADYDGILQTEHAVRLHEISHYLNTAHCCPDELPDTYHNAHIQHINIKGVDLVKLYIPVSSHGDTIHHAKHTLFGFLSEFFAQELLNVKTLTLTQHQVYNENLIHTFYDKRTKVNKSQNKTLAQTNTLSLDTLTRMLQNLHLFGLTVPQHDEKRLAGKLLDGFAIDSIFRNSCELRVSLRNDTLITPNGNLLTRQQQKTLNDSIAPK